jgi:glycogen synthase
MSSKRVTIVADELLGHVKTGGLGTAASFLALGLARGGHRVEAL